MKKKLKLSTIVLLFVLTGQAVYAKARIPIPYGTEEKIIKVLDFPDTEMFQLEDGSYFDLGSMYTKSHIVWLSYSNTEPVLVGLVEGKNGMEDSYLELTPEMLTEIEKTTGIELPKEGSVSFFDKFVGKFILGILVLSVLYGLYLKYIKKEEKETAAQA